MIQDKKMKELYDKYYDDNFCFDCANTGYVTVVNAPDDYYDKKCHCHEA